MDARRTGLVMHNFLLIAKVLKIRYIAIILAAAILGLGCERNAPTATDRASDHGTSASPTYSPFSLYIHTNVGTSGSASIVHDVSEKTIEEEIRGINWVSSEQLVELVGPRGKLIARGYVAATEEWFQLHIVSRQRNSKSPKFSRNLSGVDEVVDVFQSYVRQDGEWESSLTWSDELRPVPHRLLPEKMQNDPDRIPSDLRVDGTVE